MRRGRGCGEKDDPSHQDLMKFKSSTNQSSAASTAATALAVQGCSGRPSTDTIVLMGHAFQPNAVATTVPGRSAVAVSTTDLPAAGERRGAARI